MGNCTSQPNQDEKACSDLIDKQLEDDGKRFKKECKILLLGSGESGKSTIVKQMKIIHQGGFTTEERDSYRGTIYKNVLDSAQAIALMMRKIGIQYANESNQREPMTSFRPISPMPYTSSAKTPPIPQLLDEHSSDFYLMDSAFYFFTEVLRIGAPGYTPTETDILRARATTTAITETRFTMGQLQIHMFDVGGQRSERRKWIHCFESVTSIIFCTAISEYDQVLLEDKKQNRMAESLVLFESVINSRWFLRTSIVLFLNKSDSATSPEFPGGKDINKAAKYILWRFMKANRARLSVYPHLTQATDTANVRLVFVAVKETILQNALKDSGIL
ncbi:heterotrimeric G-protein alpha subunit, GPA3-like protein [Desarmillaria tabescens]|uniref:Heterotrimeric G-protein alpha subunit, GPA3-like protein n=1 Tax=Armillaria tabescens TaxID=1929756 RepID=A0AA39JP23_ARMTA|nr:heterotrimeric G-protein alpha subunit, GPA3-like protein [Desarmillaria tabescens]KAK0443968.1 heterotrimeric G-protein alpha subunit, GPA3-like protein [Desarmillaria tabescens]